MKKEFVPYELAVKLKALGFDEPCLFAFDNCSTPMRCSNLRTNDQKFNGVNYNSSTYTSQPTFSQAFRWFRERYSLYSHIRESYAFHNTLGFVSQINGSCVTHGIVDKPINRFDTYEEAELACLTKLIEIVEHELNKSE